MDERQEADVRYMTANHPARTISASAIVLFVGRKPSALKSATGEDDELHMSSETSLAVRVRIAGDRVVALERPWAPSASALRERREIRFISELPRRLVRHPSV